MAFNVHFFLLVLVEAEHALIIIIRTSKIVWTKILRKIFIGAGMSSKLGLIVVPSTFLIITPTFYEGYQLSIGWIDSAVAEKIFIAQLRQANSKVETLLRPKSILISINRFVFCRGDDSLALFSDNLQFCVGVEDTDHNEQDAQS